MVRCISNGDGVSQRERGRETETERGQARKTEKISGQQCTQHTLWSGPQSKPKTTMQVSPGMRQEQGFIRLAIIQTQEWTAVSQNNLSFQTAPH